MGTVKQCLDEDVHGTSSASPLVLVQDQEKRETAGQNEERASGDGGADKGIGWSKPEAWAQQGHLPGTFVNGTSVDCGGGIDVDSGWTAPLVICADNGFPINGQGLHYFEVKVTQLDVGSTMAVGLVAEDRSGYANGVYPGWKPGTFGLHSVGEIYNGGSSSMNGNDSSFSRPFSPGDTVGCGWVPEKEQIFFTLNGKLLGVAFSQVLDLVGKAQIDQYQKRDSLSQGNRQDQGNDNFSLPLQLWPVVGIRSPGISLTGNFRGPFLWEEMSNKMPSESIELVGDNAWKFEDVQRDLEEYVSFGPLNTLHRATNRPRQLIMKALKRGRQKYFPPSGKKNPRVDSEGHEINDDQEEHERNVSGQCGAEDELDEDGPALHFKRHLSGVAQKVSTTFASLVSSTEDEGEEVLLSKAREESLESAIMEESKAIDDRSNMHRLAKLIKELGDLKEQLRIVRQTIEDDPLVAQDIMAHVEANAEQLRQRLFNMVPETQSDETLADLISLFDQLFDMIEAAQQLKSGLSSIRSDSNRAKMVASAGAETLPSSSSISEAALVAKKLSAAAAGLAGGDLSPTSTEPTLPDSEAELEEPEGASPVSRESSSAELNSASGGLAIRSASGQSGNSSSISKRPPADHQEQGQPSLEQYGVSQGTAHSVRELLFFIRSGGEQAQLNAARALSYLVRDHQRSSEIRTWSRIDACQGGGISTLVAVLHSKRAAGNPKLRHAVSVTIAAIASGSWISIGENGNSKHISDQTMNPGVVASSFASDLASIVTACKVLVEEPCYCCDAPSWPQDENADNDGRGRCAFTQREAALALANLCLIFYTRDQLCDDAECSAPSGSPDSPRALSRARSASTGVGAGSGSGASSSGSPLSSEDVGQSGWALEMQMQAAEILGSICTSELPRIAPSTDSRLHHEEEEAELREKQVAWSESRRLSCFAISILAQYPGTHQGLLDSGILDPLVQNLERSDPELLLHSATTIYWLCSGACPTIANLHSLDSQDKSSLQSPKKTKEVDLLTVGFIVAKLLASGALSGLITLAKRSDLPSGLRTITLACFASLSSVQLCQGTLCTADGAQALLNLASQPIKSFSRLQQKGRLASDSSFSTLASSNGSRDEPAAKDQYPAAAAAAAAKLNASVKDIRRRLSSSGKRQSIVEIETSLAVANSPREQQQSHHESSRSLSGEPDIVEAGDSDVFDDDSHAATDLCYFSFALHNFSKAHRGMRALLDSASGMHLIIRACQTLQNNDFFLLHMVRTLFTFSETDKDACARLESAGASLALMDVLRHVESDSSKILSSEDRTHALAERNEIRVTSWLTLGNLASSSYKVRSSIAFAGAVEFVIAILNRLYGLSEPLMEVRASAPPFQPMSPQPANHDARSSPAQVTAAPPTPPREHYAGSMRNAASLNEPQGLEIEVAHQAVRVLAGIIELVAFWSSRNVVRRPHKSKQRDQPGQKGDLESPIIGIQSHGAKGEVVSLVCEDARNNKENIMSLDEWDRLVQIFAGNVEQILVVTILLLGSPHAVIQFESCRALSAVMRCPAAEPFRYDIARLALEHLVQLSVGGIGGVEFPDRQLQLGAENVLKGLGFAGGVEDVRHCGRDARGMLNWHKIMLSVEHQQLMEVVQLATVCKVWQAPVVRHPIVQMRLKSAFARVRRWAEHSVKKGLEKRSNSLMTIDTHPGPSTANTGMLASSQAGLRANIVRPFDKQLEDLLALLEDDEKAEVESIGAAATIAKSSNGKGLSSKRSFSDSRWFKRLVACGLRAAAGLPEPAGEATRVFGDMESAQRKSVRRIERSVTLEVAKYLGALFEEKTFVDHADPVMALRSTGETKKQINGVLGTLPLNCQKSLEADFPSLLHRRRLVMPLLYVCDSSSARSNRSSGGLSWIWPRAPLVISFENGQDLSKRFGNIMSKIMEAFETNEADDVAAVGGSGGTNSDGRVGACRDTASATSVDAGSNSSSQRRGSTKSRPDSEEWSISIHDCRNAPCLSDNLMDCLFRFPTVTSLSFSSSSSSSPTPTASDADTAALSNVAGHNEGGEENVFANIVRNLPSSVASCTFDGVLNRDELGDIVECFMRRASNMGLLGLGIINSDFKQSDLQSLARMLTPNGALHGASPAGRFSPSMDRYSPDIKAPSKQPAMKLKHKLRWVDLSGNLLRDAGCAMILRAIASSQSLGTVESLNLSCNQIGSSAKETIAALTGDAKRNKPALLANNRCVEIHLAENGIGSAAVSTLFKHMAATECKIHTLGLQRNALEDSKTLLDALVECIAASKSLYELDLSYNALGEAFGKELRAATLGSSLHFLHLRGNSRVRIRDLERIESSLLDNRQRWMAEKMLAIAAPKSRPKKNQVQRPAAPTLKVPKSASSAKDCTNTGGSRDDATALVHVGGATMEQTVHAESVTLRVDQQAHRLPHASSSSGTTGSAVSTNSLESKDDEIQFRPRLSVMFSIPLAARDHAGRLHPIESIDFERERDILWQTFVQASRDIDMSFGFATTDHLRAEVTMRCRAIHYSGHGSPHALLFEDQAGGVHPISTENLRRLASGGTDEGNQVKFVFVSACHSEFAGRAFVQAGVAHVVCVQVGARILDKAARAFTRAFYLSLAIGDTVRTAFEIAKKAVDATFSQTTEQSDTESAKARPTVGSRFLLLPQDADHNVSIFPQRKVVPKWPPPARTISTSSVDAEKARQEKRRSLWRGGHAPILSEDFIGRKVDTFSALAAVQTRRIVALVGKGGIGKSSIAVALANYANDRAMFGDGILYLRLEDITTVSELVSILCDRAVDPAGANHSDFARSTSASAGNGSIEGQEESEENRIERLHELMRYRKCVIVLDHCDELVKPFTKFGHFILRLLDETKGVRLLLTCQELQHGSTWPVTKLTVGPLSPREAARLFIRLSPHNHERLEMDPVPSAPPPPQVTSVDHGNSVHPTNIQARRQPYSLIDALSDHPVIKKLEGHPGSINQAAFSMGINEYVALIKQCRLVVANIRSVVNSTSL